MGDFAPGTCHISGACPLNTRERGGFNLSKPGKIRECSSGRSIICLTLAIQQLPGTGDHILFSDAATLTTSRNAADIDPKLPRHATRGGAGWYRVTRQGAMS